VNRSVILSLALMAIFSACTTMPRGTPFEYERVDTVNAAKDVIYQQSGLWIAETFRSASAVIDYRDEKEGVIIGNGIITTRGYDYRFKLKIEAKDNKFKMTFRNIETLSGGGPWTPVYDYGPQGGGLSEDLPVEFEALGSSLKDYITKAASRRDW